MGLQFLESGEASVEMDAAGSPNLPRWICHCRTVWSQGRSAELQLALVYSLCANLLVRLPRHAIDPVRAAPNFVAARLRRAHGWPGLGGSFFTSARPPPVPPSARLS